MKDRPRQDGQDDRKPGVRAKVAVQERRSARRQPFISEAQVVELKSGAKLLARSCDLVVQGCYVDTLNPFPVGTRVRIRLKKDDKTVEATGQVVYGTSGLGMGIAFENLTPGNRHALEEWLSGTKLGEQFSNALMSPIGVEEEPPAIQEQTAGQMADLILLLMKKGILSGVEAAALLKGSPVE